MFLVLYVDDILLATNDHGMLHQTKKFLSKNFDMKDMGEANCVIGIEIFRDRSKGLLGLSQKAYIYKDYGCEILFQDLDMLTVSPSR
jgi:Reverse transcriptase (RNA-dependent DNA polymerase)